MVREHPGTASPRESSGVTGQRTQTTATPPDFRIRLASFKLLLRISPERPALSNTSTEIDGVDTSSAGYPAALSAPRRANTTAIRIVPSANESESWTSPRRELLTYAGAWHYTHQTGTDGHAAKRDEASSRRSSMSFLSRQQCRNVDRIAFAILSCVCGLNGQGACFEFLRFRFALQLSKQQGLIVKDLSDRELSGPNAAARISIARSRLLQRRYNALDEGKHYRDQAVSQQDSHVEDPAREPECRGPV